jgi:hypothetical protein
MDLLQTAWVLLILRILSVSIILYIIFKITYPNLKAENDPQVKPVRWVLFFISVALLVGNIIPVIVDVGSIAGSFERSTKVLSTAGAIYTLNNAISHLVYSVGFLFLFIVSGQVNVKLKRENKILQDDNDELHRQVDR